MALSDCEKCWSTPCECGWEYRYMNDEEFAKFIASILTYKENKVAILEKAISIIKESK